jgi:hypothetical protein
MAEGKENPLTKEFDWYIEHQDELVARYNGRVVVIKNGEVLGDYADQSSAIAATVKTHALGSFLVQRVSPGKDGYTQIFTSRVVFSANR